MVTGCANTVVAPEPSGDSTPVFLLDHGQHASLILAARQGLTRYTYGEWGYYANNRKGPVQASGTMFGSNRAGIGRRFLDAPARIDELRRHARVRIEHAWRIEVSQDRARRLRQRFQRLFAESAGARTYNGVYDLTFVPHPAPYHMGNNSNHMTGRWLRALGCRVRMASPLSVWSVRTPTRDAPSPGP